MRIVLSLITVVGLASWVNANTWHHPENVQCPVDGSQFTVKRAKSRYIPRLDQHLLRTYLEPIYACPLCHWTGGEADLDVSIPWVRKAAALAHIALAGTPRQPWERYRLAAELSEITANNAYSAAGRYLAAARLAGVSHPQYVSLRQEALAALSRTRDKQPATAYAIAELTRQLRGAVVARKAFLRVLAHPDTSARLKKWALQAIK